MVRNLEKVLQWNEKTSGEMDLLIEWLTTTEDEKIMAESEMTEDHWELCEVY